MFCPKCSQQQVSDEMRFCSRCGFPLEGLRELLAAGGMVESERVEALAERQSKLFCEVRKSLAMMISAIPMLIFVGILAGVLSDGFAVLAVVPVLLFITGFVRLIITSSKERKQREKATPATVAQLNTTTLNAQLPPPRAKPIDNFTGHRVQTAEMAQPASVTENTTRLLDEEPAPHR